MFCQLSNGSFDIEEIMKLPFYRYAPYNDETEKFLLNKINETIAGYSTVQTTIDSIQRRNIKTLHCWFYSWIKE